MRWIPEHYEFGVPEKYDPLGKTEGGTKWVLYKQGDWLTEIRIKNNRGEGYTADYAPASYLYKIIKFYHPNGMLKSRVKYTYGVTFGKMEFFDEQGNLIKVEDEDAQYKGVRIKRENVLEILENAGVFNLKTGEHWIYGSLDTLKTDGSFYRDLDRVITFKFEPAKIEKSKEVSPPMWVIRFAFTKGMMRNIKVYNINAHTGKYFIDESEVFIEK